MLMLSPTAVQMMRLLHALLKLQIEGIAHVIKQLTSLQTTPDLDSPPYTVLKKTKEYEVRSYSSYLVAETTMPSGTRPAGGDGFQDLAGYIFGGNNRCPVAVVCILFAYRSWSNADGNL